LPVSESGPPPVPGSRSVEERERERIVRADRRSGALAPVHHHRRRRLAALALGALGVAAAWFLLSLFQPFKGEGNGDVRVVIPAGAGVGKIADLLEQRDVVSSSFFFELRATLAGHRGDLHPGTYTLKHDMSYGRALDALVAGPSPELVNLTIPEGRSRAEVAPLVTKAGLRGSYTRATVRSPALDPGDFGAEGDRTLEGFLFPATYELRRGAPVETLVRKQLDAFRSEFGTADLRFAKRKNLTAYDVLIIASMIEREAQLARERRVIASVIYNRLHKRMSLGIDATIRFATGNWTRPLTGAELHIDSPYNTRDRPGLPPGPIGNPGLASIRAAAHPARTRFLFYVVKPGTCGEHDFSTTLAEFERASRRYDAERARRGGKSPTNC
jgi:peptidoglycan lytic transglycosylase G